MKASRADQVKKLADIPNVGPAMIRDFAMLGITKPIQLKDKDAFRLYTKLSKITGARQDPCVLDTYIAVIHFMNGAPAKPWYMYTKERKLKYKNL